MGGPLGAARRTRQVVVVHGHEGRALQAGRSRLPEDGDVRLAADLRAGTARPPGPAPGAAEVCCTRRGRHRWAVRAPGQGGPRQARGALAAAGGRLTSTPASRPRGGSSCTCLQHGLVAAKPAYAGHQADRALQVRTPLLRFEDVRLHTAASAAHRPPHTVAAPVTQDTAQDGRGRLLHAAGLRLACGALSHGCTQALRAAPAPTQPAAPSRPAQAAARPC